MQGEMDRNLWLHWLLASIVTGAVSGLGLSPKGELAFLYHGALFALPQWLVLRKPLGGALWWITGTLIGMMLALGIGAIVFSAFVPGGSSVWGRILGSFLAMLPVGAILGASQMFVLTVFYHIDGARARWWIPASIVGLCLWSLNFALQLPQTLPGLQAGLPWRDIVVMTVATAAYGAVTATALVWILRGRADHKPEPPVDASQAVL